MGDGAAADVLTPLPQRAVGFDPEAEEGARRHGPVAARRYFMGGRLWRARGADAELTHTVVSPRPQRTVRTDSQRRSHSRADRSPGGGGRHLIGRRNRGRGYSVADLVVTFVAPRPQRAVVADGEGVIAIGRNGLVARIDYGGRGVGCRGTVADLGNRIGTPTPQVERAAASQQDDGQGERGNGARSAQRTRHTMLWNKGR